MNFALNRSEDNRILSVCVVLSNGNYDSMPIVNELPEGDITDYLYAGGEFVYDPKPEPDPAPEPSADLAERVAAVESDVADLTAAIEKGLAL